MATTNDSESSESKTQGQGVTVPDEQQATSAREQPGTSARPAAAPRGRAQPAAAEESAVKLAAEKLKADVKAILAAVQAAGQQADTASEAGELGKLGAEQAKQLEERAQIQKRLAVSTGAATRQREQGLLDQAERSLRRAGARRLEVDRQRQRKAAKAKKLTKLNEDLGAAQKRIEVATATWLAEEAELLQLLERTAALDDVSKVARKAADSFWDQGKSPAKDLVAVFGSKWTKRFEAIANEAKPGPNPDLADRLEHDEPRLKLAQKLLDGVPERLAAVQLGDAAKKARDEAEKILDKNQPGPEIESWTLQLEEADWDLLVELVAAYRSLVEIGAQLPSDRAKERVAELRKQVTDGSDELGKLLERANSEIADIDKTIEDSVYSYGRDYLLSLLRLDNAKP